MWHNPRNTLKTTPLGFFAAHRPDYTRRMSSVAGGWALQWHCHRTLDGHEDQNMALGPGVPRCRRLNGKLRVLFVSSISSCCTQKRSGNPAVLIRGWASEGWQMIRKRQAESDDSWTGCNDSKWYKDLFVPTLHDGLTAVKSTTSAARWAQLRVLVWGMVDDYFRLDCGACRKVGVGPIGWAVCSGCWTELRLLRRSSHQNCVVWQMARDGRLWL